MKTSHKTKVAVWKLTSCDGCQLALLDCEEQLEAIARTVDFAYFPEFTSRRKRGRYDISLVEGAVTTPSEKELIQAVRHKSDILVAMGACATAGGIQALRNFTDTAKFVAAVYPEPGYIRTLDRATPITAHVSVDFEIRGCPVDNNQLLEVLCALRAGRRPQIPRYSLCMECKRRGIVCVTVAKGIPCLGPVTQAGCGALCPGFGRGCYGCFGPQDSANTTAMRRVLEQSHVGEKEQIRMFRSFNAAAEAFLVEEETLETESTANQASDPD